MPTFIKTGYWDKLSKAPKEYLNLDLLISQQAGGGGVTSATKVEVDTLISTNSLVPGAYYLISGVDVPLYGGTTILIQAATTNELALAGHGVFYNPKYLNSQATPENGYGIWSNYITLTMSEIVGTFTNGETVTADNGAVATYLTEGFLQFISGDWSLATTIDNGAGATADVMDGISPSYTIGQDVIWGGKHWTNTTGNVGTADDKYTLSAADWTAVAFNATNYSIEIDIIHYDYSHDMIIRRKDKWNNDVDGNFVVFTQFASPDGNDLGNPIKDFQWGNGSKDYNIDDNNSIGVQSNYVKDSYFECINFIGRYLWLNTLTQKSYIHNNITNISGRIYNNTLNNNAFIYNNILTNSSRINSNELTNSDINDNQLIDNSGIGRNVLNICNINNNILNNSNLSKNILNNNSNIDNNTLNSSSNIGDNTLNDSSNIADNTLYISSSISENILHDSDINTNVLNMSFINNNTLTNSSAINGNISDTDSRIDSNRLSNGSVIDGSTLTNSYIGSNIDNETIGNTLNNYSYINTSTLIDSYINSNTLNNSSGLNNNTLTSSRINGNALTNSSEINENALTVDSNINNNILIYFSQINSSTLNSSSINTNTLNDSNINSNTLSNTVIGSNILYESAFNFSISGTLTSKTIVYIEANFANATFDISAATIIYGTYSKQMFRNSAGVTRLGYYNGSDVFTVVNVNA